MTRAAYPTRRTTLARQQIESIRTSTTPAARLAMVWPVTLQTWLFKESDIGEPRLRRDVVRIIRGRR